MNTISNLIVFCPFETHADNCDATNTILLESTIELRHDNCLSALSVILWRSDKGSMLISKLRDVSVISMVPYFTKILRDMDN